MEESVRRGGRLVLGCWLALLGNSFLGMARWCSPITSVDLSSQPVLVGKSQAA